MDDPHTLAHPWRRLLRAGLGHLRCGDFDAAERSFERAHRLAPERAEVCCALGRERLRRGRLDEAEALLRASVAAAPTLATAAASLARCLGLHGHPPHDQGARLAEAAAVLDRAERARGPSSTFDVVRGELALEAGDHEAALGHAELALARADADDVAASAVRVLVARVENQRGVALTDAGDADAALFAFKRAADLDPSWSAPHCNMGSAFLALGRAERAREAFARARTLDPSSPSAARNLALLLAARDDPGATEALEDALELAAGDRAVAAALVRRHLAAGRSDRAIAVLERATAASPDDPELWIDLARLLARLDDLAGSEACLRNALALAPDHPRGGRALAVLRGKAAGDENAADVPPPDAPGSLHWTRS